MKHTSLYMAPQQGMLGIKDVVNVNVTSMLSINDLHEEEYASFKQHFEAVATLKLQEKYNEIHNRIEDALRTDWDKPYNAATFKEEWEEKWELAKLFKQEAKGFDEAVVLILGEEAQAKLWDHYRVEFLGEELEEDATKPTQDEQRTNDRN